MTKYRLPHLAVGFFVLTLPVSAVIANVVADTSVESIDPSAPAHRDVLVVTFAGERRSSQLSAISHPPSAIGARARVT